MFGTLLVYSHPKLSILSEFLFFIIAHFQGSNSKRIYWQGDIGKYLNNFTAFIITSYDNNSNWIKIIINNLLSRKNSELNK
ncbi:hypothetical protein KEL17_10480, partial [Enterococcus faecium]|nr:hypothetical protein [Enterococcus faecium]